MYTDLQIDKQGNIFINGKSSLVNEPNKFLQDLDIIFRVAPGELYWNTVIGFDWVVLLREKDIQNIYQSILNVQNYSNIIFKNVELGVDGQGITVKVNILYDGEDHIAEYIGGGE